MDSNDRGLPAHSRSVWSDVRLFLLGRPPIATLIDSTSPEGRERYTRRIHQRLGLSVEGYSILNIHRIGIDASDAFVFDVLLQWRDVTRCWPDHLAKLVREPDRPGRIDVLLLGRQHGLPGIRRELFGLNVVPLFTMRLARVQEEPGRGEFEDARYLLYECTGGYPAGIFCAYVRPSIPAEGEREQTQMFLAVGFNFYGKPEPRRTRLRDRAWELIHNRVTGNILNRLKQTCEARLHAARRAQPERRSANTSTGAAKPLAS
ncbi:MAG: hypothetical protein ACYTGP_08510 [Planctomycetota bacterium]